MKPRSIRSSVSRLALCPSAFLFAALLSVPAVQASLIWQADFESYNTSAGAAALTINSTGNNDTFTATSPSNLGTVSPEVRKSGAPAFMSGNALYIGGASTAASINFQLQQAAIASMTGNGGVLVVSFDVFSDSASQVSISGEGRTASGRDGTSLFSASTVASMPYRVTIVINRSGATITLPDTLGTLDNRSSAIYRFDGTSYSGISLGAENSVGWSSITAGFATGFSLSSSVVGSAYGMWLDNFGAWDSLSDTVNGTNILSLAPGTALSSIPEPSTLTLLAGIAALAGVTGFRRLRRACAE